jgi:hypothetical protein
MMVQEEEEAAWWDFGKGGRGDREQCRCSSGGPNAQDPPRADNLHERTKYEIRQTRRKGPEIDRTFLFRCSFRFGGRGRSVTRGITLLFVTIAVQVVVRIRKRVGTQCEEITQFIDGHLRVLGCSTQHFSEPLLRQLTLVDLFFNGTCEKI